MASLFTSAFDEPLAVNRGSADAASWQALQISIGRGGHISLSLNEAQQLVIDLQRELAAVEAAARAVVP